VAHLTYLLLDTKLLEPFEIGALLDALLCYPTWSEERQQAVAVAICAEIVGHWAEAQPELKAEYPHYKKSAARTSLRSLRKRRDQALEAGLAFLPHLKRAAIGQLPRFEGAERELSFSEVARFLWPPREGGDEVNYESRIHDLQRALRNSYPTAHLAAAYQYIAREQTGRELAAAFDYEDMGLHREAVRRANEFAGYFRATSRLAKIGRRLITLEWRD
jgi:hypothetical protein